MKKHKPIGQVKKPQSNKNHHSDIHKSDFIAWCKEFNVGILSNKDATIEVVVGNSIKHVKLDQPF